MQAALARATFVERSITVEGADYRCQVFVPASRVR